MVSLLALSLSFAVAVPACCRVQSETHSSTKEEHDVETNKDSFSALEFVRKRTTGQITIQWDAPEQVVVSVWLIGKPEVKLERTWQGPPTGAEKIRAEVTFLQDEKLDRVEEYTLRSMPEGAAAATVIWSDGAETEKMASLRRMLEEAGHLHCAEAMAYLKRGRVLVADKDHSKAVQPLRVGIEILGDRYEDPDSIDDTGMKLVMARSNQEKEEFETAATLLDRVLESRIRQYLHLRFGEGGAKYYLEE